MVQQALNRNLSQTMGAEGQGHFTQRSHRYKTPDYGGNPDFVVSVGRMCAFAECKSVVLRDYHESWSFSQNFDIFFNKWRRKYESEQTEQHDNLKALSKKGHDVFFEFLIRTPNREYWVEVQGNQIWN